MGRINRRIYSTRRKRSPNKLRFASPSSMSSQSINQMGQAQASGNLNIGNSSNGGINPDGMYSGGNTGGVRPKTPPYLGGDSGGEGIGGGKTYTITQA